MIGKFSSILTSFDALRPLLRDRKRDDLLVNIDIVLLEGVLEILQKAEAMFDILALLLCNLFCMHTTCFVITGQELPSTDSATGRILKRNLVTALDEKMWMDITALHVAASYLDPSWKSFSFVKDGKE